MQQPEVAASFRAIARHSMALTRRQRELFKEAEAIAALTKLDYHKTEEADPEVRILLLRIAINNMVIAQMVTCYTLLDEILSDLTNRPDLTNRHPRAVAPEGPMGADASNR
jgi:hypothetical protein